MRVDGVAPDRYDQLELNAEYRSPDGAIIGSRAVILKLSQGTNLVADDRLEESGLVVFMSGDQPGTIKVRVTDPCDRQAGAEHSAAP